jgi:hypothetical protein
MSTDVYGATVILMAVASLVAIRVSRHRVHSLLLAVSRPAIGAQRVVAAADVAFGAPPRYKRTAAA